MTQAASPALRAAWLGAAAVYLACADTAILIDGFFTRPSLPRMLFTRLQPDRQKIASGLELANITRLDAVIASHTHYDHALDAPAIAAQTGAILIGSDSLQYIARAVDFPTERFKQIQPGSSLSLGSYQLTFAASRHNQPELAPGDIRAPLHLPAHALRFKGGQSFAITIHSPAGRVGFLGSAGWLPGMFQPHSLDALYLSIAGLHRLSSNELNSFFAAVVLESGAQVIYPIHWDNFFTPFTVPSGFLPKPLDEIDRTISQLHRLCQIHAVKCVLPPFYQPHDPFLTSP